MSQEVSVENKAKALQFRILSQHVQTKTWNDTLSKRVNSILIDFLDPNRIYFSQEQVTALNEKVGSISTDIPDRKTVYLDAIKSIYISELKAYQTLLTTEAQKAISLKNEKTPKITYSFEKFCPASQLKERRKLFIQQQLFDELFELHENKEVVPTAELTKDEETARKKLTTRQDLLTTMIIKDSNIIDDYYLYSIAQSVDPHTLYFTESLMRSFKSELSVDQERFGFNYGLNAENKVVLKKLFPGSSAWLSGKLKENDILKEVGLKQNKEWKFTEISDGLVGLNELENLLKSYSEKEIQLVVEHENKVTEKVLLLKTKIYNDNELVKNVILGNEEKLGYIQLSDFYTDMTGFNFGNGCANDLAKCILKLKKDSIHGLILDLRGNGGGSLKEAIELTGIFIDYGPVLAYLDRSGTFATLKDANRGLIYDGPLMILIDEESASASEIVAGALQDHGKALIVGKNSFGKATSQQILATDPLATFGGANLDASNENFGFVNLTEGILYRINSETNQQKGIQPDILFPNALRFGEGEFEKELPAAIVAPPMTKKLTYTPSTTIPKGALVTWSENYFKTPAMISELAKRQSIRQIIAEEEYVFLDYNTYFSTLKRLENEIKELLDESIYIDKSMIQSNSFDQKLYEQNQILSTFQTDFQDQLSNDIELKFAMELMNQWLSIINK